MTYRIECSVAIKASPEIVWATIQDPSHRTRWDERVVDAQFLTPPPKGKGTHFRVTYSIFGVRSWIELEYVKWNPMRQSGVRSVGFSRGTLFKSVAGSWHFGHNEDGSTTWTTKVSVSMRGGKLAQLFEKAFVGWFFKRLTEKSQVNLKRLIESQPQVYLDMEKRSAQPIAENG